MKITLIIFIISYSKVKQQIHSEGVPKAQSNPVGAPKSKPESPPARLLPLCSKCFCVINKGVYHPCTKTQKQTNLAGFVKSNSGRTKGKITSNVLKSMCSEAGVSTGGGTISLKTGGRPITVKVGNPQKAPKIPKFTHESLKRLQAANNFSDRAIK